MSDVDSEVQFNIRENSSRTPEIDQRHTNDQTNEAYYTVASATETESEIEGPVFNEETDGDDVQAGADVCDTRVVKQKDQNRRTSQQRNYRHSHRSRSPIFRDQQNTNNCNDETAGPSNLENKTAEEKQSEKEGRSRQRRVYIRDSERHQVTTDSEDSDYEEYEKFRPRRPTLNRHREHGRSYTYETGKHKRNRSGWYELGHGDTRVTEISPVRHRSQLPVIKPESFDGTEDWEGYFSHFTNCAELGKWSDEEKALTLASCLKGSARTFYLGLREPERRIYRILIRKLSERFGSKKQQARYITKLETRRRNIGETVAMFGDDLRLMAQRAYPDLGADAQESLALHQFFKTLSPEMKCRCIDRECKTIEDAVEVVERYESILGPDEKKKSAVRSVVNVQSKTDKTQFHNGPDTSEDTVNRQIREILSRLERMEARVSSQRDPNILNDLTRVEQRDSRYSGCFICKSQDHIARRCPNRNTQNEKHTNQSGNARPLA